MAGFSTPKIEGKLSLRASVTGSIVLEDVRVPKANMLPLARGLGVRLIEFFKSFGYYQYVFPTPILRFTFTHRCLDHLPLRSAKICLLKALISLMLFVRAIRRARSAA